MSLSRPMLPAMLLVAGLLTGCNVWQKTAEFAPPESRWPKGLPSAVDADSTPPALRTQYCYRTLATVDCFPDKQIGRSGYTGSYPGE
jgi:hypothetical protein